MNACKLEMHVLCWLVFICCYAFIVMVIVSMYGRPNMHF